MDWCLNTVGQFYNEQTKVKYVKNQGKTYSQIVYKLRSFEYVINYTYHHRLLPLKLFYKSFILIPCLFIESSRDIVLEFFLCFTLS